MKPKLKIVASSKVNMGGIILEQPLPNNDVSTVDPYLLIHHWKEVLPGDQKQKEVGVGPHPHRGFAPISFIYSGDLHHRDSFGNDSIVTAGGTQWMFAGKGVTHSERPSVSFAEKGGLLEFIQIWLNVPAVNKMDAPKYYALEQENTPSVNIDKNSSLEIVSGQFNQIKGAIPSQSPVNIYRITLKENDEILIPIDKGFDTCFYVLDGDVSIHDDHVKTKEFAVVENKIESLQLKANKDTRILFLSGLPIKEKVATYGPFVMNNQTELMEAIRDSQKGKMGVLIEEW